MLQPLPEIVLVVPCYNETARLRPAAFADCLARFPSVRFCFVDDGSTDRTSELLERMVSREPERVCLLRLPTNRGKAEAVRQGVLRVLSRARGRDLYIGYWDADLATPLGQLTSFFSVLRRHGRCTVLCGSRIQRLGSRIDRRWYRHLLGRVFATLASIVLDLRVYDTQCGAKLFRADIAGRLFARPFLSRWCFDVELLARAVSCYGRANVLSTAVEVPLLRWSDKAGSKLRTAHYVTALRDLALIWWHYRLRRT